jgi:hypothetical protein
MACTAGQSRSRGDGGCGTWIQQVAAGAYAHGLCPGHNKACCALFGGNSKMMRKMLPSYAEQGLPVVVW